MRRSRSKRQAEIAFPSTWGGRRKGAGRKRTHPHSIPHVRRPEIDPRHPVHVTLRMEKGVWSLRSKRSFRVLDQAFRVGAQRLGIRLTHYSVQGNHIHLVVEAESRTALSRGMQGLTIRISKGLNRMMGRTGKVFARRFHARVLTTPREVRTVIRYVLENARKHDLLPSWVAHDPYAGGTGLDGRLRPTVFGTAPPVAAPATWLLRVGWQRAA